MVEHKTAGPVPQGGAYSDTHAYSGMSQSAVPPPPPKSQEAEMPGAATDVCTLPAVDSELPAGAEHSAFRQAAHDDKAHVDEEQRVMQELAALELEADEAERQRRALSPPEAHSFEPIEGLSPMQAALDRYEPGVGIRPFSPPPGTALPGSAPVSAVSSISSFPGLEPTSDAAEPGEFRGMLFHDGVDALGRPVVVVNADALAGRTSRRDAFAYMLHRLEPIVLQGPYVLVMLNAGHAHKSNRLPAKWLISAFRSLSRPFRKNVKLILLVRPSTALRALLTLLRPFISPKARRKVVKVESLAAIATATRGEVCVEHLGPRFAAAAAQYSPDGALAGGTTMPLDPGAEASGPLPGLKQHGSPGWHAGAPPATQNGGAARPASAAGAGAGVSLVKEEDASIVSPAASHLSSVSTPFAPEAFTQLPLGEDGQQPP